MSKLLSLNKRFKSRLTGLLPSMLSLTNSKELITTLRKVAWKVISVTTSKVRISPRLRAFNKFLLYILSVHNHHGPTYTVKYLKACHMAVQRKLSSQPFKSLREIEPNYPFPQLINGLPKFIGTKDRSAIRAGCPSTIRLWLSLLSIYRVIKTPYKVNLSTITDKWTGNMETLLAISEVSDFIIKNNKLNRDIKELRAEELHRSLASGPNCNVAISAILTDAIAIAKYPEIYDSIKSYCLMTSSFKLFKLLDNAINFMYGLLTNYESLTVKVNHSVTSFDDIALGKLAFKEEAAGKLRVFAIVDIWTQSLFKPLHNSIFGLLHRLPNDGTLDQDASFARSLEKSKQYNCAYSVDLSSATDRLPIYLQALIIDSIYKTKGLGKLWSSILVDRPYIVRRDDYGLEPNSYYSYGTGQPMGCLSSWAMLAITHHLIVQTCAYRVYGSSNWFDKYEILGDDLVIFDRKIYEEYILLMADLKVGVNPSKSLISDSLNSFEFAKRTGLEGVDVSGISWKQLLTETSVVGRTNFALSMMKKGFITNPSIAVKAIVDSHYIHFQDIFKDSSLRILVENACIGILGSFVNKQKITLAAAVSLLIDPQIEADELDSENLRPPLFKSLQMMFEVLNFEGKKEDFKSKIISKYDSRVKMAKVEVVRFMFDDMMREAYSRILLFEKDYDNKLLIHAKSLITEKSYERLNKVERAQLVSFAEATLLKDRDPSALADEIKNILLKERELVPMDTALKYSMKVDNFISSLDVTPVKRSAKPSELPRLIVDAANTGRIKGTPYWETLNSNAKSLT